jgi:hypothetical protein
MGSVEGREAIQHLVKDCTKGPDISFVAILHVLESPDVFIFWCAYVGISLFSLVVN